MGLYQRQILKFLINVSITEFIQYTFVDIIEYNILSGYGGLGKNSIVPYRKIKNWPIYSRKILKCVLSTGDW